MKFTQRLTILLIILSVFATFSYAQKTQIKPISNEFTNFYKPSPTRSQQAPQSTILPPLSSGSETPTSPTDAAAPTPTSQINTSGASSTHKQTGFVIILASFVGALLFF
ncbi:3051_t:CDS:2 [Entrophospora sp. SA101]|nr:3051_t:CDS:2 [Entrophospora sp. SA101]CAJ0915608.1 22594_t:CDS:2 [Entrophospora sp. SA101]CAJ0923495.1 20736_t:CDS:2 [Entrophospora sp. SA101]